MKVLIDHPIPFALAHGGLQGQIEQTNAALERRGVEVEYLRWWDDKQTGQIIHYFGRPGGSYIDFAHAKGVKVVVAELLSGLGSRSAGARFLQKSLMQTAQAALPKSFLSKLAWDAYQKADAFVANTKWEAYLMQSMFGAAPAKVHVVTNGVEEIFFQAPTIGSEKPEADYLVCTAVIHPRKRVLELAQSAVLAKVPVWIVGKPYSESDPYYLSFLEVQKRHSDIIRYEGGISDRARLAQIYRQARGFVLLSTMETLSFSSLEAAASKRPLLLSDLPWARMTFGADAVYAKGSLGPESLSPILREFFEKAPSMRPSFKPLNWDEVAGLFQALYEKLLR
ncbi:MAG: glycosyltransferase family 4 protein [Methylacidiphilales bacterium]|nr:glycosyltransferase family 4 protein [Candidatus Methylacidiphilales bacterium]